MESLGVVILAAGEGTRMRSGRHKVLHEVAGRSMIERVLDAAAPLHASRTVVIVGHLGDQVRAALGDRVTYVDQSERRGTGHAVLQTRPILEGCVDDVLVLYGDTCLTRPETVKRVVDLHQETDATLTQLTAVLPDATGYGRIVRDAAGRMVAIVEESMASPEERLIREMNAGPCCIDAAWLWRALERLEPARNGELYLVGLVALAVAEGRRVETVQGDEVEAMGVNDRVQLAAVEAAARERIRRRHLLAGVTMIDPATCYIDEAVEIERDVTLLPGTFLLGQTRVGAGSVIGPYAQVVDSTIGERCRIWSSVVEHATLEDDVTVGPMSHLRPGTHLHRGVGIGNFAEVKNSVLGPNTKMGHFSYLGDAQLGADVNVGAGTITCNFDPETGLKSRTVIGDHVGLGCDTLLNAPVTLGDRSVTGSGAVVTRDLPPDSVAYGVPARVQRTRRAPGEATTDAHR